MIQAFSRRVTRKELSREIDPHQLFKLEICADTNKERLLYKETNKPACSHTFDGGQLTSFLVNAKEKKRSHCLQCHAMIIEKETESQKSLTAKTYQPKPTYFLGDITALTLKNVFYRQVVFTSKRLQIVLQHLKVGEDIDMERHESMEQTIHIVSGHCRVSFDFERLKTLTKKDLYAGYMATIPRLTYHRIENASKTEPLLFYTMYTEDDHPENFIQKDKYDLPIEGYVILYKEPMALHTTLGKFASLNDTKLLNVKIVYKWFIQKNTNEKFRYIENNLNRSTEVSSETQKLIKDIDAFLKEEKDK
jgi:mannose-6-phosphate isomerase-like protein (cupin superfamily)